MNKFNNICFNYLIDKDKRDDVLATLKDIVINNCAYDEKMSKFNESIKDLIDNVDETDTDEIMKTFDVSKTHF
jgi:lysine/ornithine N-monooxygenase